MRLVNWLVPLAMAALGLTMALWLIPAIQAGAGGLAILDVRGMGYGQGEAKAFLTALTPEAKALYLGPFRLVDTAFPILLTVTLILPLRGWPPLAFVPALIYGLADLTEDWAVAQVLTAGPEAAPGPVLLASVLTMVKFAAMACAAGLALAGLVGAWRARKAR